MNSIVVPWYIIFRVCEIYAPKYFVITKIHLIVSMDERFLAYKTFLEVDYDQLENMKSSAETVIVKRDRE